MQLTLQLTQRTLIVRAVYYGGPQKSFKVDKKRQDKTVKFEVSKNVTERSRKMTTYSLLNINFKQVHDGDRSQKLKKSSYDREKGHT